MILIHYVIFNTFTYQKLCFLMDLNVYFINNRKMRNVKCMLDSSSYIICIGRLIVHVVLILIQLLSVYLSLEGELF